MKELIDVYAIKSDFGYWNMPAQEWEKDPSEYVYYDTLEFAKIIFEIIEYDYEFDNIRIVEIINDKEYRVNLNKKTS